MRSRLYGPVIALVVAGLFAFPAGASDLTLPGCTVEPGMANAGGTRFTCPGSEWVGAVDQQGGIFVPGDPKKLNHNISAGNRQDPGYVVLVADVGKGVIVDDGESHPKKLLVLRNPRYGRSEFRTRVRFERGLTLCDRRGCFDVARMLRRLRAK